MCKYILHRCLYIDVKSTQKAMISIVLHEVSTTVSDRLRSWRKPKTYIAAERRGSLSASVHFAGLSFEDDPIVWYLGVLGRVLTCIVAPWRLAFLTLIVHGSALCRLGHVQCIPWPQRFPVLGTEIEIC